MFTAIRHASSLVSSLAADRRLSTPLGPKLVTVAESRIVVSWGTVLRFYRRSKTGRCGACGSSGPAASSTISGNSLPKRMLAIGSPPILGWQSVRPSQVLPISGRHQGIGGDGHDGGLFSPHLFRLRSSLHDGSTLLIPRPGRRKAAGSQLSRPSAFIRSL